MTLQLAGHRVRAWSSTNSQNHPGLLHLKPREGPATSNALEKRDLGSCSLQRTRLSTTQRATSWAGTQVRFVPVSQLALNFLHYFVPGTLGLLRAVAVTAANVQDRAGAESLLACLQHQCSRLRCIWRCIWADQAYTGDLAAWVWGLRPWRKVRLEIVKCPEGSPGFLLLPKRWVVERTFAWLGRYRRFSKDYES